jgi:predicted XRE-type DNA-binding protein
MSVWDDITDTAEEAENLKVRAALMRTIRARIEDFGWSQTTASKNLGMTQPRVSALMRGKISEFSLDALVAIAAKVGVHVQVVSADDELVAHPIPPPE